MKGRAIRIRAQVVQALLTLGVVFILSVLLMEVYNLVTEEREIVPSGRHGTMTERLDTGLHAVGSAIEVRSGLEIAEPTLFLRYDDFRLRAGFDSYARRWLHVGGAYEPRGYTYLTFSLPKRQKMLAEEKVTILTSGLAGCSLADGSARRDVLQEEQIRGTRFSKIEYLREAADVKIYGFARTPVRATHAINLRIIGGFVHFKSAKTKKDEWTKIRRGIVELDCQTEVIPERTSFSTRYLIVDTIYDPQLWAGPTSLVLPMRARIAPPYSSTDWIFNGDALSQAPPRRIDGRTRSDWPASWGSLTKEQPSMGAGWTYQEAEQTREVALVFVGAVAGALVSLAISWLLSEIASIIGRPDGA